MTVTELPSWNKPKAQCDGVSSQELLAANPGMTYRQVHYWTTTKRLLCHLHLGRGPAITYRDGEGTGRQACYPPDQAAVAARMYRLTKLGIEVDMAHQIASDLNVSTRLFDELGRITREQWRA